MGLQDGLLVHLFALEVELIELLGFEHVRVDGDREDIVLRDDLELVLEAPEDLSVRLNSHRNSSLQAKRNLKGKKIK